MPQKCKKGEAKVMVKTHEIKGSSDKRLCIGLNCMCKGFVVKCWLWWRGHSKVNFLKRFLKFVNLMAVERVFHFIF